MMGVRCGRCGTEFPVEGAGRYPCPACGAANEVRPAPTPEPSLTVPPPAPEPMASSPRATCNGCSFSFIVGDVDVAVCPNCGDEVAVKRNP
jgi:predicted RNA-binding Zn-ribbon protein involved in translation (DUF1610 family)